MTEQPTLKHISIRGVNAAIYDEFSTKVGELDIKIGEALTQMMRDVLQNFDDTFPELSSESLKKIAKLNSGTIQHMKNVTISRKDLVDADMRVHFQHISGLKFEPDVDEETFNTFVGSIQHCNQIKIPSILPKLKILSRLQHCSNIKIYDPDEGVGEATDPEPLEG